MSLLNKIVKDLFTEADNETYDMVRAGGMASVIYYLMLVGVELWKGCDHFSIMQLSQSVALVIASFGGVVGFKYAQEKKSQKKD